MPWNEEEDKTIYKVVVNHEEQYSIWPADRENPLGWCDVGKSGLKLLSVLFRVVSHCDSPGANARADRFCRDQ